MKTNKNEYETPVMDIVYVEAEQCFAGSFGFEEAEEELW